MLKRVIVTFDCESIFGMPHSDDSYDFAGTIEKLLNVLSKHKVSATFFVVGKLIDDEPDVIKRIFAAGHEIGLHGYEHEHINKLSEEYFELFLKNINRVENKLESITGLKPVSFRSPYLNMPNFYEHRLYSALSKKGYKNISNREIRVPEELFLPGRIPFGMSILGFKLVRKFWAIFI